METDRREESSRIVVVSGVPDPLPVSRMVDKLTIHFLSRRRSRGGDVEVVTYPTNMDGVAFVTFDKAEDAERVVRKKQQLMKDNEFPDDYLLTVFPFTRDMFLYVHSATVDLSVFGRDPSTLIQSLRSAHRSLHFRPSPQQTKATVEGPFSAIQALRQDLILRAGQHKSVKVSARAAAVKPRESPLNPRVMAHREVVGSVKSGGSEAKPGLGGSSHGLSTQATGEAAEVQSPLLNGKTRTVSRRRKVSHESLAAAGSFCDTHGNGEEEPRDRSRREMPAEYRTELLNAGLTSSLSGLDLHRAEEISATQPAVDGTSEKRTGPDRISAPEIRGENTTSSFYSRTDYLKDPDQSSSALTAKILRTKDASMSSKSHAEDAEEPSAEGDACVWVDSYICRYIEKFDKWEFDRCLRGLDVRVVHESADLTRISWTETGSRTWQASEDLNSLVEYWLLMLRVHRIDLDGQLERHKLIQICDDVNALCHNVLYLLEDACVKVIGTSVSGPRFCRWVEDRVALLKDPLRMERMGHE
ncbi:uncharacterized protein LOC116386119 [Anarrhichthys ocellatus]|uniref:uncharacterized protein LOC116386119 n=1 Tax=Anarrhichthys ocellatus TaxID=433405 RepID=UPI0012ED3DD5|nr:RNA-binding protein 43 [Anarrhichthys ocellatus]